MAESVQWWLTVGTVAAAAAWLVWRLLLPRESPGCDGCASATAPVRPPRGIRRKALRVLPHPGRAR